jgi:DNA-directed RNA polymerase sigma subunit (sigma70/sigma32)
MQYTPKHNTEKGREFIRNMYFLFEGHEQTPVIDIVSLTPEQIDSYIDKVDEALDESQSFVISHRYGYTTGKPQTLANIGKQLGVSGERIRIIEHQAIKEISDIFKE